MPTAYVFTAFGGPEVEEFRELPTPVPGPGQLLVAVHAAGVNPADWKRRAGYVPTSHFPVVFGREVAGVVEQVGQDVTDFAVGDAVFGTPDTGGFAEYTLVPVEIAAHVPDGLALTTAATLPIAAATAYDGIRQLALAPGSTLLITGAGGGVGIAAAQLARHDGIRVIGTAGRGKKTLVEAFGATHVESGPGVVDRVRAAAPEGIDAIYDMVGGSALEEVAPLLPDRSKLIAAADVATVTRLGGAPVARAHTRAVLDAVAQLALDGGLDPHITATYPLEAAGRALRAVEDGHATGKIVIEVRP